MCKSTVSNIIIDTCNAIYDCLEDTFLSRPKTQEDWFGIAAQFEEKRNMPYFIGAIDAKHLRMECPKLTASQYFNYKVFFSMVLLDICDAKYCFVLFDLGQYGSSNDSSVLLKSLMGQMFKESCLNDPEGKCPRENVGNLPFYLTCDEILPLKTWLAHAIIPRTHDD